MSDIFGDDSDVLGQSGQVETGELADGAVTTDKLAASSVTASKIANTALVEFLPRRINIDPAIEVPTAQTNWSTIAFSTSAARWGYLQSSGAQNAEISWTLSLAAGTWTIDLNHHRSTNVGIYSVRIDNVEVGTVDGYVASPTFNNRNSVTGVVVTTTGSHVLKLVMATKNASSSSFFGVIQGVGMRRTA